MQGIDFENLLPGGKNEHFGRVMTFKGPVHSGVQHPHRVRMNHLYAPPTIIHEPPLKGRLRLFGATVTPTIMYVVGTYTLTEAMKNKTQHYPKTHVANDHSNKKKIISGQKGTMRKNLQRQEKQTESNNAYFSNQD